VRILSRQDFPTDRKAFLKDFISGITVAIVALPLAIGFGITSGMSAAAGISTAIIAGFIAGLLGGSRFQVSGPTGAMTVVLIPVIHNYGIVAIPTLGFMAGAMVLLMALFKLGNLIKKVPIPVVEGFTVGIALVISLQQIPYALGVSKGQGERTLEIAANTIQSALHIGLKWQTILVVVVTLLIKFNIVRIVESFKMKMYFPASFSALFFSIAILVAIESLLSARVADDISNTPLDKQFRPNQELFGQGSATAVASIFGGMPATGAIARTNVNVRSGAITRVSAMVHSIFLLLIVVFLAPIFSRIPSAAIAGVLIGTSFRIFNKASMLEIFRSSKRNIFIYIITALVTVSIDLIWGIAVGIALYLIINQFKRAITTKIFRK